MVDHIALLIRILNKVEDQSSDKPEYLQAITVEELEKVTTQCRSGLRTLISLLMIRASPFGTSPTSFVSLNYISDIVEESLVSFYS
jgi:hypothetical protein